MPSAPYFLDTNVLVYAATGRRDAPEKRAKANDLVSKSNFAISTQVLQEFYWIVTRKPPVPLTTVRAMAWIEQLLEVSLVIVDPELIKAAALMSVRFQIAYWDAAILAAAERADASVVYTEDLNHGQFYGPVRVINPFLPSPAA
jgi:predicted nucleic acid-binding protein